jgi:hypothetical protein
MRSTSAEGVELPRIGEKDRLNGKLVGDLKFLEEELQLLHEGGTTSPSSSPVCPV